MKTATLSRRLSALEKGSKTEPSPAVKEWLGMPLTEAEQRELACSPPSEFSAARVEESGLSQAVKDWLLQGINHAT